MTNLLVILPAIPLIGLKRKINVTFLFICNLSIYSRTFKIFTYKFLSYISDNLYYK